MSCKALQLEICARNGDHLNSYIFTYSEKIDDCEFFIDLRSELGVVIKRYSIGAGLSFLSENKLLWDFGNVLEIPAGKYNFGIKIVIDGKPNTDLVGVLRVKSEVTSWKL